MKVVRTVTPTYWDGESIWSALGISRNLLTSVVVTLLNDRIEHRIAGFDTLDRSFENLFGRHTAGSYRSGDAKSIK